MYFTTARRYRLIHGLILLSLGQALTWHYGEAMSSSLGMHYAGNSISLFI